MRHEMMRQQLPPQHPENVGDVLSSIWRLIAQDEAGDEIPNELLNSCPQTAEAAAEPIGPAVLKLDSSDLVVHRAGNPDPDMSPDNAAIQDFMSLPENAPCLSDDPGRAAPDRNDIAHQAQIMEHAPNAATDNRTETTQNLMTNKVEETMLHANASVTPITAPADASAKIDEANAEISEPHLFSRQDKDAQKGTHLRGMIREAIRQELQGEIGNRLSRNLQQMIRHEIELTLRQMCEQD